MERNILVLPWLLIAVVTAATDPTTPNLAPKDPCTTAPNTTLGPVATCSGYKCPPGYTVRPRAELIKCFKAEACSAVDQGSCCLPVALAPTPIPGCTAVSCPAGWSLKLNANLINCEVTGCTVASCCAQPTTPPPRSEPISKLINPHGCRLPIPPGAHEPWEVYKYLRNSATKIRAESKLLMGGRTVALTGMTNISSELFECRNIDHEMRAVVRDASLGQGVAALGIHDTENPSQYSQSCRLKQISMFNSEVAIPGLRFDYVCDIGVARKASVLMGLRKVPEDQPSAGLAAFFQDVCGGAKTPSSPKLLDFLAAQQATVGGACFATSANMQLFTSDADCYEPGMVMTMLDQGNHFPIIPVRDSEWVYFSNAIPKPKPLGQSVKPSSDPCAPAPVEVFPKVYGDVVVDRVCVGLPELSCHNDCGKFCEVSLLSAATTPTPNCSKCFDCYYDEIIYAVIATFLAFNLTQIFFWLLRRCCFPGGYMTSADEYAILPWTQVPTIHSTLQYEELSKDHAVEKLHPDEWKSKAMAKTHEWGRCGGKEGYRYAVLNFFFVSLVMTIVSYYLVNWLNWFIVVNSMEKEMCIKIWDFQTNLPEGWQFNVDDWSFAGMYTGFQDEVHRCYNEVCQFRLVGLILATWICITGIFSYWRLCTAESQRSFHYHKAEAQYESGAGGGGGTGIPGI